MFSRIVSTFARNRFNLIAAASGTAVASALLASSQTAQAEDKPFFVINGFYMSMREAYTAPGKSIYYMTVEWPSDRLSWGDFRGKVLGATDPKSAAAGSVRNDIFKQWQTLGLDSEPNTGNNGVHASASPFEALAERVNWLGANIESDAFGATMIKAGIPKQTVTDWTLDPQVPFEGTKSSLFDLLEDMDAQPCLNKAAKIANAKPSGWGGMPKIGTNSAFVFIKPHAVNEPTKKLLKAKFDSVGIKITSEGSLDSKTIDQKKLIDQHYYSIANKATLTAPKDLNPPAKGIEKFGKMFGISWKKALDDNCVYNASQACAELGVDGNELELLFRDAKKGGDCIKFGGGFYCAKIQPPAKKSSGFLGWLLGK